MPSNQTILSPMPSSTDMREATRSAVRHMITFLGAEYGLSREEAYMLCSVAGDLRLHEVVRLGVFPNILLEALL